MTTKFQTTVFLFLIIGLAAFGQTDLRSTPKKIKAKGDYLHSYSMTTFPLQFETFKRQSINSFDRSDKNVGVVYDRKIGDKSSTITIYIYPAGDGYEGRLRSEYITSMQSIANVSDNGFHATQYAVKHKGEKYICNGFKAISKSSSKGINQLTLYECGTWFFKIRLTTNELDSIQITEIENKILEKFDPSRLTALRPLNVKADVYFAKIAFRDSTLLGSAMGSAIKKIEWATENIKEDERASGFPSLYLDMQVEALKEFVKFHNEKKWTIEDEWTSNYLSELNAIIDASFLNEFIMEQFDMIVIVPDNLTVDFEAFQKFKESKKLTIDLNQKFYVASYGQK
jgi:hypothetical protein